MSSRGWPGPGDDWTGEMGAVARRARGLLPPLRPGSLGIGVAALLMLILLLSSWFTVQPAETGVVQRFGAVVRTVGPGLHFKLPRYLFRVRESRQTIRDIAEAVMRQIVGNRLGSDVLTVGRVAVSAKVKEEMQRILNDYETGVRLVTVELQDVTPPDPVKPAFNEVNEARQDRERTINQAQEKANQEIPKARGEAARTISEAEGHAVEKRLLIWDGDPNQIPTKGREFIWVDTTARWRIADAKKFLENVATEAGARSRLDDIIDSVVRDQVSASELVELVRSASWEVPEGEVLEEVPAEVREELKKEVSRGREEITRTILAEARKVIPQYGIELVDVRIKRLDYVESVREKVYARMISERKRIAARFRSEGEGRSAEILGTMEKELRQIRSAAYRRAQEIRGKADAEATRIYGDAYSRNPEFYAFSRTSRPTRTGRTPTQC